jgi:hypothetical protein
MAHPNIPIFERSETIKEVSTPDVQSAYLEYAKANNSLSAIGSHVAQASSNAMAAQLGYEAGKNPEGGNYPTITEFDKNFAESYNTEAHATLSLQADKLLSNAQIEMSKATRLTPELIDRTNNQLQAGLNKIASNAPFAIKGKLEQSFNSTLLSHNTQYKERMFREQREDQKNNLVSGLDLSVKNAYELASNGDFKGASLAVQSAKAGSSTGLANRYLTPVQAKAAHDSAVQAELNGRYTYLAMQAYKNNKYAAFEKEYAKDKQGMTEEQWMTAGQAFVKQINFIESLKSENENIQSQQMLNRIALNPNTITPSEMLDFQQQVSPLMYEKVQFHYIQALKKNSSDTLAQDSLIQGWGNPEIQANATSKLQNSTFNKLVDASIEHNKSKGINQTRDDAEVDIAAHAGSTVPVFIDSMRNKLRSGNPAMMESAIRQMDSLRRINAGHAMIGLSDDDKAVGELYMSLRNGMEPTKAAQEAINLTYNQDPAMKIANKQKWTDYVHGLTTSAINKRETLESSMLNQVGLSNSNFINPAVANVYANDIITKFGAFYQASNGNADIAKKLTQQFVDENYGDTYVNGEKSTTLHPIEKQVGFTSDDGTPYIHQDLLGQLERKFKSIKESYDKNEVNEYWEIMPPREKSRWSPFSTTPPAQIKRHVRSGKGSKEDVFDVVLMGNSVDSWDVNINTSAGMQPLFQVAPYLNVLTYQPDIKKIRENFNKQNKLH